MDTCLILMAFRFCFVFECPSKPRLSATPTSSRRASGYACLTLDLQLFSVLMRESLPTLGSREEKQG